MRTFTHDPRRRLLLSAGGGLLLSAAVAGRTAAAGEIEIALFGTPSGSHVGFRPRGLLIQPGQSVRWVNRNAGNVHTTTAYHPKNGKPRRIPPNAQSWNSDYLMPNDSFVMEFSVPGVYDYYCIPHEMAGMVGRIVVGQADASVRPYAETDASLPAAALSSLPEVGDIVKALLID